MRAPQPAHWRAIGLAGACITLLLLPDLLPQLAPNQTDANHSGPLDQLGRLSIGIMLSLGLAAAVGRLRWLLPLALLPVALAPLETGYVLMFGQPTGPGVYGVIADTHSEELRSWLGLAPGLLLLLAALWLGLLTWVGRELWRQDWRWRGRSRLWAAVGALLLLLAALLIGGLEHRADAEQQAFRELQAHAPGLEALPEPGLRSRIEASYPWGLPLRLRHWQAQRQALRQHRRRVAGQALGISALPGPAMSGRQVHVLVIGESSRPDRWQLYGAARDTTPRLRQLDDEQLLRFDDAVSAAAATRESVPLMLTRRPPQTPLAIRAEPSLLSAYRQAGYRSYWLSTQGAAGGHETPVSVIADEADERRFLNAADYRSASALDGELLPVLAEVLARGEPRQLIVLHTLGSHLHYAHRYPVDFEFFRPALPRKVDSNVWMRSRREELLNAYDNSLRYTDHVLAEAIALLHRSGVAATLSYVADHGETFWDGRCSSGGHGFAAIANYRVPLLFWASERWRSEHAARWRRLQSRQRAPVSSLALFATLSAHAGFRVEGQQSHQDLGAEDWQAAPRWLAYHGDFDRQLSVSACDASPAAASAAAAAAAPAAASAGHGGTR